ncbi:2OG-Fe(II) oxygenase [Povalibacter sp.]|uniref:2OG-Fe(II) oxygenase n=1 Tax=Povalibacter sp. TaxID=1962978 RepID=UPI002F4095ED
MTPFALSSPLDAAALAGEFAHHGRVRIRNFLAASAAERLHQCLLDEVPWKLVCDERGTAVVLKDASRVSEQQIMPAVIGQARDRFQYLYCSYPMVTAYLRGDDPGLLLHRVLEWLNEPRLLELIRDITGITTLRKADAQATWYRPGHFLTLHDDGGATGEMRRVAYVLNLTRRWQADWGGLLHFVDERGDVAASWRPEFNTLVLFRVPVRHTVSQVAPFAGEPRFAITGWFRDS